MNILLLLGLLTLTVPAPVHAADKSGEPPAIRYFQYWVRYGEKAARPGGYGSLSFELEKNRMNVFAPEPAGNFCGPADSSVIRDFSVLAAGLGPANPERIPSPCLRRKGKRAASGR